MTTKESNTTSSASTKIFRYGVCGGCISIFLLISSVFAFDSAMPTVQSSLEDPIGGVQQPQQQRMGLIASTASLLFHSVTPILRNMTEINVLNAIPDMTGAFIYGNASSSNLAEAILNFATSQYFLTRVAIVVAIIGLIKYLFFPYVLIRRMEDIGYIQEKRRTAQKLALDTKMRRKKGNLPPPYPNGWYRLMDSRDLNKGDVKNIDCLGQHFVVFRGENNGKASVLDAYCPHLGANLGIGGKVKDDCIECPFHGWAFDDDGKCVKIPYATGKIPDVAKTKKWHCLEMNSHILVWFDAEDREPLWIPPCLEEVNNGNWTFRGSTEHNINSHIQEVPENGADIAHLMHVHSPIMTSGIDLRDTRTPNGPSYKFLGQHLWEASWTPGEGVDSHIGFLNLVHRLSMFGFNVSPLDFYVEAMQVGPALVYLKWRSFFGRGVFIQGLTPVAPMEQMLCHSVYAEWKVPTFFAKFAMLGEALQVERDIMIWNNKCFIDKPLLVKEDQLIGKWRRWYSQFYSENSRKFEVTEKSLDW